jgi:hypothetical protein
MWRKRSPQFVAACEAARHEVAREMLQSESERLRGELPRLITAELDLAFNAKSETVRQSATSDLLDRILGRPRQGLEVGIAPLLNAERREETRHLSDDVLLAILAGGLDESSPPASSSSTEGL